MPELPEVESVRLGLMHYLPDAKIRSIETKHPRALDSRSIAPLNTLVGMRVDEVKRRGKYLWFTFHDADEVLVAHLGMSGQFRVTEGQERARTPLHQHTRVTMELRHRKASPKEFRLDFVDQRTFGWMRIDSMGDSTVPSSIEHVAPDPFESEFDRRSVIHRISTRKSEIKRVLLDQGTISGIGNIYADEALWRAKIHPERIAHTLSDLEVSRLLIAVREVMQRALKSGGTSFDHLYVNVNGESGYFSNRLAVYGREDESCRRCRAQIKRIVFTNRSSHFCPRCQRLR